MDRRSSGGKHLQRGALLQGGSSLARGSSLEGDYCGAGLFQPEALFDRPSFGARLLWKALSVKICLPARSFPKEALMRQRALRARPFWTNTCQWFSGKIQRCQRWAPSSILGWRSTGYQCRLVAFLQGCLHCRAARRPVESNPRHLARSGDRGRAKAAPARAPFCCGGDFIAVTSHGVSSWWRSHRADESSGGISGKFRFFFYTRRKTSNFKVDFRAK